jgi:hypothetical protein
MAITYRNLLIVFNDENRTAQIMDAYDGQFVIVQEGGMFIVTEKICDKDVQTFETDDLYTALEFVKDWT